jgi:hypothetical protein
MVGMRERGDRERGNEGGGWRGWVLMDNDKYNGLGIVGFY